MSYELKTERTEQNRLVRTYVNKQGTEIKTSNIYTDKDGVKWWGFNDLYNIPIIRIVMARHITDLYTIGLTLKDILKWCNEEKTLLKGTDPEKYEKLYALVLEKEKIASFTADPVKQHLATCTVYVLADDERVDFFNEQMAEDKLKTWLTYPEMITFFLSWHTDHINRYIKSLDKISTTVLKLEAKEKELQQPRRSG